MKKYCLIKAGKIIEEPRLLPKTWKNISGLNLLSDVQLKNIGWIEAIDTTRVIDKETEKVGPLVFSSVDENAASFTREIISLSKKEKDDTMVEKRISAIIDRETNARRESAIAELKAEEEISSNYGAICITK